MIDFTASWCGPCKFMAPVFNALAEKFTDVEFIKMDVDQLKVIFTCIFLSLFLIVLILFLWSFYYSILCFENRKWRRSLTWRRCQRSCCWRMGRKLIGLLAPTRRSLRTRLRKIEVLVRKLSSSILFIQLCLCVFLFKGKNKTFYEWLHLAVVLWWWCCKISKYK